MQLEAKRYWLKKLHSDPGADPRNRWGRCPGFRNRKVKHRDLDGGYPLSRLIWVDWKNEAQIPILSPQPQGGGVCRKKEISRMDYMRGNESVTDFAYAVALARRGYSHDEIKNRLFMERSNWKNHKGPRRIQSYLLRTTVRAIQVVENS